MKKRCSRIILLVVAALVGLSSMAPVQAQGPDQETIVVRGSDSMAAMVDAYAKEFMGRNPKAHIVVSGGADKGWKALMNGESAICMASSEPTSEEKKVAQEQNKEILSKIVGWGGVVIIVHPSNPIDELTVDQVRAIFSGELANWKDLGGTDSEIKIFTVGDKREGTLQYVRNELLKAQISPNAVVRSYFRSIVGGVAEAPSATSFVRIRNIMQLEEQGQRNKVKVVAVKQDAKSLPVLPSRETVNNGTYPLCRPYFLYMDARTNSQLAKDFFEFAASKNPRTQISGAR